MSRADSLDPIVDLERNSAWGDRATMNSTPIVSIVVPFFNRIDWTIQAVQSVLAQSFQEFEIILVDDGSTDRLDSLLLFEDRRLKFLHQTNLGPAAARNNGMRHAQGKYIAFLDADDSFLPGKLACQVAIHDQNPTIRFSHTSYQRTNANGELLEIMHAGRFHGSLFPAILYGCPISSSTVMFNRDVMEKGLWYEEDYRVSEDIIFYSKVARHFDIVGLDDPLSLVRMTDESHALDPRKQIVGSKNILHYVKSGKPGLSRSERRKVITEVYGYMALNYQEIRQPLNSLSFLLRGFLLSPQWTVLDALRGRYLKIPFLQPAYRFLRSIYHSIRRDSQERERLYWYWVMVSVYSRIPFLHPIYRSFRSAYRSIARHPFHEGPVSFLDHPKTEMKTALEYSGDLPAETLPLVTLITSTYKNERYLRQTIESVLSQDYPRIEYMVFNDGSPDRTEEILRSYEGRIYWETHPNIGEVPTLNKALRIAKGDLIGKLSSDDYLYPGAIRKVVEKLVQGPGLVVVYPDFDLVDENGVVLQTIHKPEFDPVSVVRDHLCLPGPGTLFRRGLVDEIGEFDGQFRILFDMDFWWRAGLVGQIARLPETLSAFRQHRESQSSSGGERMAEETVGCVRKFYAQPRLPKRLLKVKGEALSNALYSAGMQCAQTKNFKASRAYLAKSIIYSPTSYLKLANRAKLANVVEVLFPPRASSTIRSFLGKAKRGG